MAALLSRRTCDALRATLAREASDEQATIAFAYALQCGNVLPAFYRERVIACAITYNRERYEDMCNETYVASATQISQVVA